MYGQLNSTLFTKPPEMSCCDVVDSMDLLLHPKAEWSHTSSDSWSKEFLGHKILKCCWDLMIVSRCMCVCVSLMMTCSYFIFWGSLGNQTKHSEYLPGNSSLRVALGRGYVSSQEGDYKFTLAWRYFWSIILMTLGSLWEQRVWICKDSTWFTSFLMQGNPFQTMFCCHQNIYRYFLNRF